MASNIYRIQNNSHETVHVMLLSTATQSYDLVIGPKKALTYKDVVSSNPPVPTPANADDFKQHRLRLRVGRKVHTLYRYQDVTRLTEGDTFATDGNAIPGYTGAGNIGIVIAADSTISAERAP